MTAAHSPLLAPTDQEAFVAALGGIVEHSPWVAEQAFAQAPFADLTELHGAFAGALLAAPHEAQIAVLRAHPDLAVSSDALPALTPESASEQAGAGLDRLDDDRRRALATMLAEYRARFGFPFIVCVRDHGGAGLETLAASRLHGTPEQELQTALGEVISIARHRLSDLVHEAAA